MVFGIFSNSIGQSVTYNSGSGNFSVPHKITQLDVQVWGGGGGGGFNSSANRPAAGGGGGGFTRHTSFSVTPGSDINYVVGIGGFGGSSTVTSTNGGTSSFSTLVANGGVRGNVLTGGTGGTGTGGTSNFNGGSSQNSGGSNNHGGTGGGGGAGPGGIGGTGDINSTGTGGAGGTSPSGGIGGNGGNNNNSGLNGTAPGGAGGGAGGNGSQGGNGGSGRIIVSWTCSISLTSGAGSNNPIVCQGTGIGPITYVVAGGYGATVTGLPAGVTANYTNGDLTISGTPSVTGSFNYTITPTGSCTSSTATGTITITPNNTAGTITSNTFCANSALPGGVTQSTTGATGIGVPTGLPPGVSVAWASNQITFSGTPTTSGTYNYSIPLTGGCGTINATGTITVNAVPAITAQATPGDTTCINGAAFAPMSVGTGFGYTYQWFSNSANNNSTGTAIPGATSNTYTPLNSTAGTLYYYVVVSSPGCTSVTSPVSAAYVVNPNNTVSAPSVNNQIACQNSLITPITHTTTGATGIGTPTGLPTGVTASWSANTLTISGTPTTPGTFNYSIPLTGGCGTVNATGTIIVNALPAIISPSLGAQTRCQNVAFSSLSVGTGQGWTYQWYSNSTASNSGGTLIPGATSNSFTPPSNVVGDMYYYVVVSSQTSCGTAATSAVSGLHRVNPLPVVSFTAQPSGTHCVDTDLTYTTQSGQTNYIWTIPGVAGTDYTLVSGGNSSSNTAVIRWLTPGTKSISVNYTDPNSCGSTSPATSSTITVLKNTATPPSNPNPTACYTGSFTTITHTTVGATGIGTPTGLPAGLTATWTGTATNGTITISGTVSPSESPGPKSYSIPLNGGCGTVSATGIIEVEPEYTLTQINSVSPSNTGGSATITLNLSPSTLANGDYVVNYQMGLANPRAATNVTVNFTNGVGTFFTSSITNEDLTSLTVNSIRKASDPTSCPVPLNTNNVTFFGIQPKIFDSNGTFFVPAGIFQITVKVYGGGGGGGRGSNGAGGGGGGYSERTINVVPGEPLAIFVGSGGAGQTGAPAAGNGLPSYVTRDSNHPNPQASSVAYAFGGGGANGGTRGAAAATGLNGTINQPGNIGGLPTGTTGGNGGNGGGPDGGAGGAGGSGTGNRPGFPGTPFGGGGGGSKGNADGGSGASGYVIITYPLPPVSSCFTVIDDGSVTGTAIIQFNCNSTWTAPEGLTGFRTTVGGAGGGGGFGSGSGGGGAGQLIHNQNYSTTNPAGFPAGTSFSITVGQGGVGATSLNEKGGLGGLSSISGNIDGSPISVIAEGGGGGGSRENGPGLNGASGGGGAAIPTPQTNFNGGTGMTGTPPIGSAGGRGDASGSGAHAGGGGGGIVTVGINGQGAGAGQGKGGDGGHGRQYQIGSLLINYGAGGGGIGNNFNGVNKFNGEGGKVYSLTNNLLDIKIGGDGNQDNSTSIGQQGQDLTGSGGGAGFAGGGRGGNGVVYIYYDVFRILPLDYLYFNATYNATNREVNLSWAVAKEWENSHFEVERAVNQIQNWTKVGEVTGKGFSDSPVEYSFIDKNLPAAGGNIFYRLKQVNFSGTYFYSATRSIQVEAVAGASSWIIYPNPTSGVGFRLELVSQDRLLEGDVTATVSTILGQTERFNDPNIEDLSEKLGNYLQTKAAGVYILTLNWAGKTESFRIIKN